MITNLQPSLEKHPFLADMSPDALALMTGCVKNVRFAAGDYLFRASTDAAIFYLLRTGRVNLLAPGPSTSLLVHTLGPGALVGWSWIIAPYRYRFDARATEATAAFEVDGKCLRAKCEANPALGYQLLERTVIEIGQRMDDLQLRLLDVFGGAQVADDPMVPRPFRVVERRQETHDTVTFAITSAGPVPTPAFAPGQFTMLYAFGAGEVPISISGSPSRRDRLTHTVRGIGAVSWALTEMPVGGMIGVRGPFGSAWPHRRRPGSDLVIVAGGIGLAPLRPVIYDALEHRENYRHVCVLVGARSEADLLFSGEFETWRAGGIEVLVTLDAASERWTGRVGVVTRLVPMATFRPSQCTAMVCGPEIMMRFAALTLLDAGVSSRDVHMTMERNMKCAIGRCGHCQYGPDFLCKQGPVFALAHVSDRMFHSEV